MPAPGVAMRGADRRDQDDPALPLRTHGWQCRLAGVDGAHEIRVELLLDKIERRILDRTHPAKPALLTRTSKRPKRSMVASTTSRAFLPSVTSSRCASSWSGNCDARSSSVRGWRAVATTLRPSASAASTIERPKPTELPVTSHVSFIDTSVLNDYRGG